MHDFTAMEDPEAGMLGEQCKFAYRARR